MYVTIAIPEIDEYQDGFPAFWRNLYFVGSISQNFEVNALVLSYVRLVEAALIEYRLGASKFKEYWDIRSIGLDAVFRSVAHFESCLSSMDRAIKCYQRLRRHKGGDPVVLLLNHSVPSFFREKIAKRIRDIRNEIHHLDEHLIQGTFREGQWLALRPYGPEAPHPSEDGQTVKTFDRLAIAGRELLFVDLASWLREMSDTANIMANFDRRASVHPASDGG